MKGSLFALLLSTVSVIADSGSGDDTDDGLDGGAIAGIVIGVLAALGVIGGLVYYYYYRPMKMESKSTTPASTSTHFGDNHLPMVALKVSGDDDL